MVNEGVVEQDRLVDVGASVVSGAGRAPVGAQKTFRSYDPGAGAVDLAGARGVGA